MYAGEFPDPRSYDFPPWVLADEYFYDGSDIISFGNELSLNNLREAYRKGIFPWYVKGMPLPWFCPRKRAILRLADLHIPRSLEKIRRRSEFTFSIDKAFPSVIENCARVRRSDGYETWITAEFIERYTQLFDEGMAHSVEVRNANGELCGGLYGVDAGGVFCGESMFHLEPNASKLGLLFLMEHLKERGSDWIDIQVMTPHLKALGAQEISRQAFLMKLERTQELGLRLFE